MKKFLFLFLVAGSIFFTACNSGSSKSNAGNSDPIAQEVADEQHAEFYVGGSCDMCTDRIEKTVSEIEGVTLASYNLADQQLHLHFAANKTSLDAIGRALAAVGHDTDNHKADDAVYEALPGCCHYRK